MSRIGKKPIAIPAGVKVALTGNELAVEGPLGKLAYVHRPEVEVEVQDDPQQIVCTTIGSDRQSKAMHGLTRALIQNMVTGVTQGYEKRLEIVGVGYLGAVQGNQLQLRVGYANELQKPIPPGLEVTCPDQNHIVVKGVDKQQVGQFAAEVRALRKPEPYKGKGIRYDGEQIRRKAGKAAT